MGGKSNVSYDLDNIYIRLIDGQYNSGYLRGEFVFSMSRLVGVDAEHATNNKE